MRVWIRLAKVLRTDIISIPSTCLGKSEVSGDLDLIVDDMREVAELAEVESVRIAYEALAWGTYVNTWEQAWDVVERVDRPNFGICLDTFNIAARVYGDPAAVSRKTPDAEISMMTSLEKLVRTIDVKRIFYVQVVDAELLVEPLVEGHKYFNSSQNVRMSWSRNCRLFYGEEDRGAYLPIKAILKAILEDVGFKGWISAELFNRSLNESNELVPEQHARRAAESWQQMLKDFNLKCQRPQVGVDEVHRALRAQPPRPQL